MCTSKEPRELSFATLAHGAWGKRHLLFSYFDLSRHSQREVIGHQVQCCCRKPSRFSCLSWFCCSLISPAPAFLKYMTTLIKISVSFFHCLSPSLHLLSSPWFSVPSLAALLSCSLPQLWYSLPELSFLTLQTDCIWASLFSPTPFIHPSCITFCLWKLFT